MLGDVAGTSSYIGTRDPATGRAIAVVDPGSVVWSSAARWRGIVVELHRYRGLDTPEFYVPEHVVALHWTTPSSVEMKIDGAFRTARVQRGSATLLPAGTPRQVRQGAGESLVVALTQELVEQAHRADRGAPPQLEAQCVVEDGQIVRIASALEAEARAGYPSGRIYGESLGVALAAHLVTRYATSVTDAREHVGGLSACCLRRVLSYIDDHLAEDVGLDALAQIAGLSPHRFAHNFKRSVGVPPHQFVIRRRIERAKPMLRETDESIATVTYALGFGSPSRFSFLFRRETGITPSHYRASFR